MSTPINIAIVGATGLVGREILQVLEERDFPVKKLRLFAAELTDDEFLEFRGESLLVAQPDKESFNGIDLAFFCAGSILSKELCPLAAATGALCIDTTSAWRQDPEVPLVVAAVNPLKLVRCTTRRIVASPGAAAIQLITALKPLHDVACLQRIVVSTYQPVSGTGQDGIDELRVQCGELLNGRPATPKVYPHQIAFNCLPQIDAFTADGATLEETRLIDETRKVLGEARLRISATAVRVPVFYGLGAAVNLETAEPLAVDQARTLLSQAAGCEVIDTPAEFAYPMPSDTAGQDLVQIGRIRVDESVTHGLSLWLCADNLRQSALNAVQIAELLATAYCSA